MSYISNEIIANVRDFILGGDAEFTIYQEATEKSPESKVQYKVGVSPDRSIYFVYTEKSIENSKIVYQGFITTDLRFVVGKKGMPNYNQKAIKGLLWVLRHADNLPSIVHVYHHGVCSVCKRKLTDPESLKYGLGPICRERMRKLLR